MGRSFFDGMLSTREQRQRFFYFRNVTSVICAIGAYSYIGGTGGLIIAGISLVVSYMTIAPAIAFLICLIEEMYS